MIDYSISELLQEKSRKIPSESLILVSEDSTFVENDKIYFRPDNVSVIIKGERFDVNLNAIPIRKIEQDQSLEDVAESIIIARPNNSYINATKINRSIEWWISNNAEALEFPDSVMIEYTSSDGKPRTMVFERAGKLKWKLSNIIRENAPISEEPPSNDAPTKTYKAIMEKIFHEDV